MTKTTNRALFLERASYRQRRVRDAAVLLPIVGIVLMLLPLLWSGPDDGVSKSSVTVIYIFFGWVMLIFMTSAIAWLLRDAEQQDAQDEG